MSEASLSPDKGASKGNDGDRGRLTYDDAFEVLSNHRRRYLLHYLQQNGQRATLSDVAEQVAAWENGTSVEEITSDERKNVYTSLRQFHLPKMEEWALVEFDPRTGTIELDEAAASLDIYVEVVRGWDVPWSQYYLGLWLLGTTIVVAAALDVGPFAAVPDIVGGVFLVVALGISAAAHVYDQYASRIGRDDKPPELRGG